MNPADRDWIIKRYNDRLLQFGADIRTLAGGTLERRRLRFQVLTEVGIESGASVLDLGCGFGDYYAYLQERGLHVTYTGYDINPNLIEIARQTHPEATFDVLDVETTSFGKFDYIVSSNCFNLPLTTRDNYELISDILKVCYEHSNKGVAIDLLTKYVDFQSPEGFYYSPEKVLSIAKQLTKRVVLRHDYPLYEFCIYLYPDFSGWGKQV